MHILSVTLIPPGEDAQWWRISNVAEGLNANKCNVEMIHYIKKGGEAHRIIKEMTNISKEKSGSIVITSPGSFFLHHFRKLSHEKYDFVYGNTYAGTFFCIFGKLKGVPLIFDMHGISSAEIELDILEGRKRSYAEALLIKMMEYASLHFSDKIICVSKKMIDYLHDEKKIPLSKLIYGTNGADLEFFRPTNLEKIYEFKKSLKLEKKFIFGYVGGFQSYQGIEPFLEAAEQINDNNVKFVIIGGDKKLRLNNILFISKIPRIQVPLYYSLCDVLVLPRPRHLATEVAAPTKFAEYCAMGKPILTTDVGDAADLVRMYKNGIVIEDNSPENLEKGILEFLNLDPEILVEMGKNSRKLAESEFDWKIVSSNIIAGLEK